MYLCSTVYIASVIFTLVTTFTCPFVANNPIDRLIIGEAKLYFPTFTEKECGVTVGYNSSHVTVLSECEGEGQLHSFTADQLSQLSSSHTLRLSPEQSVVTTSVTSRDSSVTLRDTAYIAVFSFETSTETSVSVPVRLHSAQVHDTITVSCPAGNSAVSLIISTFKDLHNVLTEFGDGKNLYLGKDIGSCSFQVNNALTEDVTRSRRQVTSELRFDANPYEDTFPENISKGVPIMVVSASYPDRFFRSVTYSLIRHTFGKSIFKIDASSGTVTLSTELDYEENRVIRIPVLAQSETFDKAVTEVVINVEDVNDEHPNFVRDEYLFSVLDSTPIGASIGTVLATDADSTLNGQTQYSVIEAGDSFNFSVEKETGDIKIRNSLHDKSIYSFVIEACDKGTPPLKSNVTITVFVQNTTIPGVLVPRFEERNYATSISELGRRGSRVLKVRVVPDSPLQFSIIQGSTSAQNSPRCFDIDPYTGEITRLSAVDYDGSTPTYYLLVKLRTTQLPPFEDYTQVTIKLADVNDNVPLFSQSKYSASILENVPVGTYITTLTATDKDSGSNGEITYNFGSGDTANFRIDADLGHIYTKNSLDRERDSEYNFFVVAKDKGEPVPQSSGAKVKVEVLDVNDCKPVFRSPVMEAFIGEDADRGDLVTTLTSIDQDMGQNAAVTYSFINGDVDEFSLDPSTGIVRVDTELDFETKQNYSIRVQATDGKFFDEAQLVIKLEDVNDNRPLFASDEYPVTVSEDDAVGEALVKLSATDYDVGSPQNIRYAILLSDDVPFSVDEVSGWFSIRTPLDREIADRYDIEVSATDKGGLIDITRVVVTVQDINDNRPACQPPFVGSVPENSEIGTLVMTVNASDSDEGENSQLSYRLLSQQTIFAIDPQTGDITVTSPGDREERGEVEVKVEVSDNAASLPLASQCSYIIKIEDENDNSPIFSEESYIVPVSELTEVGSSFFKLECGDADEGLNGQLDFSITAGNVPPTFDINSRTGELKVIGSLNYDKVPEYLLDISVTDRAEPFHQSTAKVVIKVENANDSPPHFEKSSFYVEVAEDKPLGWIIKTISASDEDLDQELLYSLNDTFGDMFSVNKEGGVVLMRELDREDTDRYVVEVRATDNGKPPLSSSAVLEITVTDVNDNPPLLLLDRYRVSTSLDAEPGTPLLSLSISDSDTLVNGPPFHTSIVSGNIGSSFTVEDNVLKVTKPASLEADTEYTLELIVSDSGESPQTCSTSVTVAVLAVNTYPLIAESVHVNLPLFQDHVINPLVLNYSASGANPDAVMVCSLYGLHPDFWMFPNGTLMSVDRPTIGTHRLTVHISDGKHKEISSIKVQVFSLSSDAAANPLTIRLSAVTSTTFSEELFVTVLAEIFRTSPSEVVVLSAEDRPSKKRSSRNTLEISLMAKTADSIFMSVSEMKKFLSRDVGLLQERTGYIVDAIDIDPCLREPCPMASTCVSTTTYRLTHNHLTSSTTPECLCQEGYSGNRCEEKLPCFFSPCATGLCVIEEGEERCECDDNFTGLYCDIPVRHCVSSPCVNGGSCRDESVGYSCACLNGFRGTTCQIKIIPDNYCQESLCSRHSTCTSGLDDVTCTCDEGWGGAHCTYVSDSRGCDRNPCEHGGVCVQETEDYTCQCSAGFTGNHCQDDTDDCLSAPCLNGGACVDGVDGYLCDCRDGFSGTNCQRTAEPCDTSPCHNGGFCHNLESKNHICHCSPGYVGESCQTPLSAPSFCDPSPCSQHTAICTPGSLSYTCTCDLKWQGKHCEISDNSATGCALNPCYNGGTCVTQPNGFIPYTCQCEVGFTGLNCEDNINECMSNTCLNDGMCVDRTNTYECVCRSGFSGRNCQVTQDPCLSLPCRNGGKCHTVEDSFVCQCTSSYTGRNCEEHLNHCPEHHCRNGGSCGVKQDGSVTCTCQTGYHGEYCEMRYESCLSHTCLHGGTCIEAQDGFRCECPPGYKGPQCQLIEVGINEGGHFAVTVPSLKYATISFKIRTRSANGLLLYVGRYGGGNDFLILHLSGERLSLQFSVGDDLPASLLLDKKVADRKWHLLTLSLNSKQVSLTVDECHDTSSRSCFGTTTVSGAYYSLDTNTPLYLGGSDYNYPFLPDPQLFEGCFKDLYINKKLVDLSESVSEFRSTAGCMDHDCKTTCSGNQVCTTTGGVVACQCPWGQTGDCSTVAPSVTLTSPITLSVPRSALSPSATMVSIQFRTRVPDCLIYVLGSPGDGFHYILVSLKEGQPTVTLHTGVSSQLTLFGVKANDGSWHTLLLNKVLDTIELHLDSVHSVSNHTVDWTTQFSYTSRAVLSVGGVGEELEMGNERVGSGLVGCVRDVRVGNLQLDLLQGGDVTFGCDASPACVHSTCPSTHRCTDIWGDYACSCPQGLSGPDCNCPAGYTGDHCQYEIDECAPDPCVHALSCTNLMNDYTCTCKPGFAGKDCDVNVNECVTRPCENGATCLDLVNGFECRCHPRYTGELCEIDTTPCADSPCLHQGTCTEFGAGQFGCTCSIGWGGELCELPKSCDFDPCVHGSCSRRDGEFVTCECEDGWTGPTCDKVDCTACVNGHCTGGLCRCKSGYSGPSCRVEEFQTRVEISQPIQLWVIVLVAILGSLLVILVLVLVLCRKKCYQTSADKYNVLPPVHPYCQQPQYYPPVDNKANYNPYYQRGYHPPGTWSKCRNCHIPPPHSTTR